MTRMFVATALLAVLIHGFVHSRELEEEIENTAFYQIARELHRNEVLKEVTKFEENIVQHAAGMWDELLHTLTSEYDPASTLDAFCLVESTLRSQSVELPRSIATFCAEAENLGDDRLPAYFDALTSFLNVPKSPGLRTTSYNVLPSIDPLLNRSPEPVLGAIIGMTQSFTPSPIATGIAEFITDRLSRELVSRVLLDLETELRDSVYLSLVPDTFFFLRSIRRSDIDSVISGLRSAAAQDLRELPSRLVHSRREVSGGVDMEFLREVHKRLDMVRDGDTPGFALKGLSSLEVSSPEMIPLKILGILAREWYYSRNVVGITTLKYVLDESDTMFVEKLRELTTISISEPECSSPYARCGVTRFSVGPNMCCFMEAVPHEQWPPETTCSLASKEKMRELYQRVFLLLDRAEKTANGTVPPDVRQDRMLRITHEAIEHIYGYIFGEIVHEKTRPINLRMLAPFLTGYRAATELRYTDVASSFVRVLWHVRQYSGNWDEGIDDLVALEKLLMLAGSLAAASSAEEARAVLDGVADPWGSFSIKRSRGLNLTAGAYVGAVAGIQQELGNSSNVWDSDVRASLPLGIEISHGLGTGCCSVGLFLSPLDLGILTDSQLVDESSVVDWRHFLAPSAYLVLQVFRNSPVAVGVGLQLMREFGESGSESKSTDRSWDDWDSVRVVFMGAIDLTLLRL